MARKKNSPGRDLMNLVALMPWWGGVALAAVLYLLLHQLAVMPAGSINSNAQIGPTVQRMMLTSFASITQYIVPLLCLVGALVSFLGRRRRSALAADVSASSCADALNGMPWGEFELLVGEAFRQQGYNVLEKGGSGPDGGIDLVLRKGGEKVLVQCKQWRADKVGVGVVRELYGVMSAEGAAGGIVVTSGTFTADALTFAQGRNVTLMDGVKLLSLLKEGRRAARTFAPTMPASRTSSPESPACPVCESAMVRRVAKKGRTAGAQFWGCVTYPACRGTR
jgi:restriction system protein